MKLPKYRLNKKKWLIRLCIISALVFVSWGIARVEKPLCDKCNVILISLDTLSALHLPCYGYGRNTAPNLCAFAEKNLLFLNSYSQSPTTLNSHMSIFTSLYPSTHNMVNVLKDDRLNEKYITLTQMLRDNGYETIYHGSLTDIHLPLNRGLERGFHIIEGDSDIGTWPSAYNKFLSSVRKNKPTFLFLHTYAVHAPYLTGHGNHAFAKSNEYPNIPLTPDEYYSKNTPDYKFLADLVLQHKFILDKDVEKSRQIAIRLKNENDPVKATAIFNSLTPAIKIVALSTWQTSRIDLTDKNQIEYLRSLYDEKILSLDRSLSELFNLLKDPKIAKNTIVLITSDHGEEFMEHEYLYHGYNLYETSIRVPLIVSIPGTKAKRIDEMVQGIDIYPTVLSLIGIHPQSYLEGIDITGIITGKKNATKNTVLRSEYINGIGLQMGDYRYYYDKNSNNPSLYNTKNDSFEQNNIIFKNPEVAKRFERYLTAQKNN